MQGDKRENMPRQMSESLLVGLLLAFSGGLMDAYTYVFRGGVFANAQTGNLILLGINLFDGSFHNAPVLAFAEDDGLFKRSRFGLDLVKQCHLLSP